MPVKEYDIFVPLFYNDQTPIEAPKLRILQARLLEFFNGLTYFPQPNEGFWKHGDVTFRDEVVVYRVLTGDVRRARRFLRTLKQEMKRAFRQLDILIIERDVETI